MGYIKHHAIIVTSWGDYIKQAHEAAIDIFGETVSGIVSSQMNATESFFIAPDGSKENWEESNIGNERRQKFIDWVESRNDKDGGNAVSYCEVFYGDDFGDSQVVAFN
jgi:hypothetical protein